MHGAAGHFELDASKSTCVGAPDGFAGDHVNAADGPAGVGVGVSILDGLVRFDVARGIQPRDQQRFRVETYLEARF